MFFVAFSLVLPVSSASVKVGSPCSKIGQVKVINQKTYKCTKEGIRTVWKLQKKTQSKAAKPKTLSAYEERKLLAYRNLRQAVEKRSNTNVKLKYYVSDQFPADLRSLYLKQVEYASKFYSSFFTKEEIVNIYLYTEKDQAFIKDYPVFQNPSDISSRNTWFDYWAKGRGREHNLGLCAFFMEYPAGTWEGHAGLLVHSTASKTSLQPYAIQVMPHEYFHVVQDYYFRKDWEDFFQRHPDREALRGPNFYDNMFPPIYREGGANTISFILAAESEDQYLALYKDQIQKEKKQSNDIKYYARLNNEQEVIETLTEMEFKSRNPAIQQAQYLIGQLVFEWFIAEFGIEKFEALVKNQLIGTSFEENLKKSAGITLKELYKGSATHILAAFKE